MRNLDGPRDWPSGGAADPGPVSYEVFPFAANASVEGVLRCFNPGSATNSTPRAIVMHVGEGVDAASRREFAQLRGHEYIKPGLVVIHGLAFSAAQFAELSQRGAGLVWSPRSNLELYGRTIDPLGEPSLMRQLVPSGNLQSVEVCGVEKLLNLVNLDGTGDVDFQALSGRLRAALRRLGSDLAPLAECN